MRYALAIAILLLAPQAYAQEEEADGWWVVVGSVQRDRDTGHGATLSDHYLRAADRCGVKTFTAKAQQFYSLKGRGVVVVAGPFESELKGSAVLAQAKVCVSGAYLLRSTFSGE